MGSHFPRKWQAAQSWGALRQAIAGAPVASYKNEGKRQRPVSPAVIARGHRRLQERSCVDAHWDPVMIRALLIAGRRSLIGRPPARPKTKPGIKTALLRLQIV